MRKLDLLTLLHTPQSIDSAVAPFVLSWFMRLSGSVALFAIPTIIVPMWAKKPVFGLGGWTPPAQGSSIAKDSIAKFG